MGRDIRAKHLFSSHALFDDRFEIVAELGRGSFGTVYQARDVALGVEVALKVLHLHRSTNESAVSRLKAEVTLTRPLTSRNLVRIYDLKISSSGELYLSMELVSGPDLATLIQVQPDGGFPLAHALQILTDVARGIAHAHERGLIHRDLKPQNILISEHGTAKVGDFSLAKALADEESSLTQTGELLGTPYYMAPEQFQSLHVDERVDIYSWALLAFELLSGRRPFSSPAYYTLAEMHRVKPLPNLRPIRPDVPAWLVELIEQAASKDRRDRPATMIAVLQILESQSGGLNPEDAGSALLAPWRRRLQGRFLRSRRKRRVIVAVLTLTCFIGGAVLFRIFPRQAFYLGATVQSRLGSTLAEPLRAYVGMPNRADDRTLLAELLGALESTNDPDAVENSVLGLIGAGVPLDRIDSNESTPLVRAIDLDRERIISLMIAKGADLSLRGKMGENLLSYAISRQRNDACAALLESRRDWSSADVLGRTPLHYAAEGSFFLVGRALLTGKTSGYAVPPVSPDIQAKDGSTALHLLARSGASVPESMLVGYDLRRADLSLKDSEGRTALWYAASLSGSMLTHYIRGGSQELLNERDSKGISPLEAALGRLNDHNVMELIEHGADPCQRTSRGRTPLEFAAALKAVELVDTLKAAMEKKGIVCG